MTPNHASDNDAVLYAVNDNVVAYPALNASSSGYAPGEVPFPKPPQVFRDCGTGSNVSGCNTNGRPFRGILQAFYQGTRGYSVPNGAFPTPFPTGTPGMPYSRYDAHHILPRRWGGKNLPANGVFLTNSANRIYFGGSDDHQLFTTWWCAFSLNGPLVTATNCTDDTTE